MTLIGVTPAGTCEIKLNPGIEHTMHEDDICYYVGFTREEFSRVGGVQSIHHSLQQACATLAAYTMSAVGINPNELDEKNELETKGMSTNGSSTPTHSSRKMSSNSMTYQGQGVNGTDLGQSDNILLEEGQVRFFIPNQETSSMDSVSISLQPHIHVHSPSITSGGDSLRRDHDRGSANSQLVSEAKRGLQLFRFHSGLDVHANPIVKLRCHSLEVCQDTPPSTASRSPTHAEHPLVNHHTSYVLESHQLLPRLSEASEERESSPYSEDMDNDHNGDEAPPSYAQSQNDVFPSVEESTPKQLEEGHQKEHIQFLHRPRAPHLKPLKIEQESLSDIRLHPQAKSTSGRQHLHPLSHHHHHQHHHHQHHYHHHLHTGLLKPQPPGYHRSLSEGILASGGQLEPPPPTPHKKGAGSPLYSSTLSLIVPEDEVKDGNDKKLAKSLSHDNLSPRDIPHHQGHSHHFLDFIRHPSMWSAASHSNHDLQANHEVHVHAQPRAALCTSLVPMLLLSFQLNSCKEQV